MYKKDLMLVHPKDFNKANGQFIDIFNVWATGFEKYGKYNYEVRFVKDKSIKRGMIKGISVNSDQIVDIKLV